MSETLNRGLGVIAEPGDVRTYEYAAAFGAPTADATYPTKFEIEAPKKLKCKDQGTVGACVAEVLAQVSEAYFGVEMSEGHIYGAFRTNGTSGEGMLVESTLKDWRQLSTIPLHYFNYLEEMPDIKTKVENIPELNTLYDQYKITGYVCINYSQPKKDQCIKDALMGAANKYGLVAVSDKGFPGGGHCIWLTGWDDDKDAYLIKNSWGESWGPHKDGRGSLSKSKVNKVYMVLFEDLELPFTDVPKDSWYYANVKHLYLSGIINGKSETIFDPEGFVSRAELAAVIDRALTKVEDKIHVLSDMINLKTSK